MAKILIVEDDEIIAENLKSELKSWKHEVLCVDDFNQTLEIFNNFKPQLVLLDITLPTYNGFYWCQEIRNISKVPIIFISAKAEAIDMMMAYQYGADDYINKPIELNITIAKINALLRRSYDYITEINYLNFKDIKLYLTENKLSYQNKTIDLTKTENLILECLFTNGQEISKRENIIDRLWQDESFIDDNTLAVNINRIRNKLNELGLNDLIITKKGVGYYLNEGYGDE